MPEALFPGQTVKAATTFRNEEGKPFDPHTVTFNIAHLVGGQWSVQQYAPTRLSLGVYTLEFVLVVGGTWWYRNIGLNEANEVMAVSQAPFEVEPETPFTSLA